jgi:hypothetical protein
LGAGGVRLVARFHDVVLFSATLVFGADGTFVDAVLVRTADGTFVDAALVCGADGAFFCGFVSSIVFNIVIPFLVGSRSR